MNHEAIIKKMDQLFEANDYTKEETKFVKATTLSILAQIQVYEETDSERVDDILGHTFGCMLEILASELTPESRGRIQNAVEYFIEEINNEHDEHREGYQTH